MTTLKKNTTLHSLRKKFTNYISENSAEIAGGMLALSNNPCAFRTYLMLKNDNK